MGIIKGSSIFLFLVSFIWHAAVAGSIRDPLVDQTAAQKSSVSLEDSESSEGVGTLPQGVKVLRDIPYGNSGKQRMDVYLPRDARKQAPVIFMVHGGGWRTGDKALRAVVENKMARWVPRGFISFRSTTGYCRRPILCSRPRMWRGRSQRHKPKRHHGAAIRRSSF